MAVAYWQGSGSSVPGGSHMVSLDSAFFLPAFSLVSPPTSTLSYHKPMQILYSLTNKNNTYTEELYVLEVSWTTLANNSKEDFFVPGFRILLSSLWLFESEPLAEMKGVH